MRKSENIWSLENVQIASPCPKHWDEMQGDNTKRFCDGCGHHVYNFSGMTREDAEKVLRESEGGLCARIYRREDGSVMTSDCPKTEEVPVAKGFFARLRFERERNRRKKKQHRSFPGVPMPDDIPHLTGIVARPEPWTTNVDTDTSSTRSSGENGEGTEKS